MPPVPTIDLIGVSKLGVCEHAILDAGISTGGGGRPLRYHWRILAALKGNAHEERNLEFAQLNEWNATTLQTQFSASSDLDKVQIEGDLRFTPLPPGLTYIFQVGVINYMNISSCYYDEELNDPHCKSQGVLMMYKSDLKLPQLFIDGKARREVIRPTDLILAASSAPSRCGSGGAMVFSWSYTAAPGPEVMWPELDEKTRGTRNLRIQKNMLVVFQTYTLRLRGRMEVLWLSLSDSKLLECQIQLLDHTSLHTHTHTLITTLHYACCMMRSTEFKTSRLVLMLFLSIR